MFVVVVKGIVNQVGAVTHSLKTLIGNPTIVRIDMRKTVSPPIAG